MMRARGLIAVAAAGGLLLTGCGSESERSSRPPSSTSAVSSSEPNSSALSTPSSSSSRASASASSSRASSTTPSWRSAAPSSTTASRSPRPTATPAPSAPSTSTTSAAAPRAGRGLSIPSIGLDKPITPMGLRGGAIDPPSGVVQWYTGSTPPGAAGISVIAGHVTWKGPDVFYKIPQVRTGDTFTISFRGRTQKYVVYRTASVNKKELQSDSRVWGTSATPVVALITCDSSSAWRAGGRHRVSNFVVWGRPA